MGYFSLDKNGRANGTNGDIKVKDVPTASTPAPAVKSVPDTVSVIASDMLITGNIVSEGAVQILGRVVGDIQAKQVIVGDGAEIEGNITGHDIAINGASKGTIYGHTVRLKGTAKVEGEVFSKSLTIEENVQFEGVSRRLENPVELPSRAEAKLKPQPQFQNGGSHIVLASPSIPVPLV